MCVCVETVVKKCVAKYVRVYVSLFTRFHIENNMRFNSYILFARKDFICMSSCRTALIIVELALLRLGIDVIELLSFSLVLTCRVDYPWRFSDEKIV